MKSEILSCSAAEEARIAALESAFSETAQAIDQILAQTEALNMLLVRHKRYMNVASAVEYAGLFLALAMLLWLLVSPPKEAFAFLLSLAPIPVGSTAAKWIRACSIRSIGCGMSIKRSMRLACNEQPALCLRSTQSRQAPS